MSNYTRWYRDGDASATNGSKEVTGRNTYWKSAGLNPGDMLTFDNGQSFHEIGSVNSDTSITLAQNFTGNTVTNAAYAIVRNFTATMPSRIAAQTSELIHDFARYMNADMTKLNGYSAYELAVRNGYVGSEAQWLESLKGAQEWNRLDDRTNILTYNSPLAHNAFYRGKNLGTSITDAQIAAIRNSSYADLYPGDYWILPHIGRITIMGCNLDTLNKPTITVLMQSQGRYPINYTDTTEGHFTSSAMNTEIFPMILEKIKQDIPEDYIIPVTDFVADSIDANGYVNHQTANTNLTLLLPSPYNSGWVYANSDFVNRDAYDIFSKYRWPASVYYVPGPVIPEAWFSCSGGNGYWHARYSWRAKSIHYHVTQERPTTPYFHIG